MTQSRLPTVELEAKGKRYFRGHAAETDSEFQCRPRVVVLTSSLLTERMLLYANPPLTSDVSSDIQIWSTSCATESRVDRMEPFPDVRALPQFPYNYLRRLNDYAWDARHRLESRESIWRHVRQQRAGWALSALQQLAKSLTTLALERALERMVESLMLRRERSPEATQRLLGLKPDLIVSTGPHRYEEPAVVASAKRLGIPTLALITSWDNLTTKNRMPFRYDGYLVWSEQMKAELHTLHPDSRTRTVYVIGAPQFDAFFSPHFEESRESFCRRSGLDPSRPVVLYALGSPNFLKEHSAVAFLAECAMRGDLGGAQLLVRPHPLHDNGEDERLLAKFRPVVRIQRTATPGTPTARRAQSRRDIADWVSAFRHADVVVNLSSTATVDAALFDRPVVNIDYDPEPGQPNQELVKDVNHRWNHFKPIAESGGLWLVNTPNELLTAVRTYLEHPELHRARRRWIAQYVCGYTDGRSGQRLVAAIRDFAQQCRTGSTLGTPR